MSEQRDGGGAEAGARVVAFGGGHGMHACLSALRRLTDQLTAIVTVADDGGSSGRIRAERVEKEVDHRQPRKCGPVQMIAEIDARRVCGQRFDGAWQLARGRDDVGGERIQRVDVARRAGRPPVPWSGCGPA